MGKLEAIGGDNWRDFLGAELAILVLGKSDCAACAAWSEELEGWLAGGPALPPRVPPVRVGKMLLDQRGNTDFKRENTEWLKDLEDLPFTIIYRQGVRQKSFAGGGIERLESRLANLFAPG
jgi:hypothetical protein